MRFRFHGAAPLTILSACVLLFVAPLPLLVIQALPGSKPVTSANDANSPEVVLRSAPKPLVPAALGVGKQIPDIALTDLNGTRHSLKSLVGTNGLVIALTSSTCPVSKKLAPALGRLEKTYAAKGLPFVFVSSIDADSIASLKEMAKSQGWQGKFIHDKKQAFLATLSARSTTEVFVLDSARTLVYRGAVSDQYGPTWALDAPKEEHLRNALEAMLKNETPVIAATTAPGCVLEIKAKTTTLTTVTYHNQISRLVQTHCEGCHRKGGVAPFTLSTYNDVASRAAMIDRVIQGGTMPPWFAKPAEKGQQSPWMNDRSIPDADKATLLKWLAGSKPVGDPKDAPKPLPQDAEWQIGKPDLVYQLPAPIPVKAEGIMPYLIRTVETNLKEDVWVQAIEVKPTNYAVVHHVLVFAVEPGKNALFAAMDEAGGFFGAYAPGNGYLSYPETMGKKLKAGTKLVFQLHYTPNGTATTDQSKIGLKLAKRKPDYEVHVAGIANHRFVIPPGADNHSDVAKIPVPTDVKVLAFFPHMHLRGKAAKYEVVGNDGKRTTLLEVPRYDFNWQLNYRFAEPFLVPAGSRVEYTAWFDNSTKNPANPDPNKAVRWGPQTYDEMLLGYVEYYVVNGEGGLSRGGAVGERIREAIQTGGVEALFKRLDRNNDGKLSKEELGSLSNRLEQGDKDGDGFLSLDEAKNLPRR